MSAHTDLGKKTKIVFAALILIILILSPQSIGYTSTPLTQMKSGEYIKHDKVKIVGNDKLATHIRFQEHVMGTAIGSLDAINQVKTLAKSTTNVIKLKDGYSIKFLIHKDKIGLLENIRGLYKVALNKVPQLQTASIPKEELSSEALPDMFIVREFTGVNQVNNTFGLEGEGVRVAVVDTGVEYAHPDLRDALDYVILPGGFREPLVLDADESHVMFLQGFVKNEAGYIETKDTLAYIFEPWTTTITVTEDYYVGSIESASGVYRFGLTDLYFPDDIVYNFGVLLVDPTSPGNYTVAYIDFNMNADFTDDKPIHYDGDRVAEDLDNTGFYAGVLGGFFYDIGSHFTYPGEFMRGWDLNGYYLSIFYDFYGHGTSCAGSIASRGIMQYYIQGYGIKKLPGIAPKAKIVGVKALWYGNTELGMLWVAGFDEQVEEDGVRMVYSGAKRADIISNSWGISYQWYDYYAFGYDMESMIINGLSVPGFLDPNFPGIIVVQAAGNGGFGYGTVTAPGAASFAITVGASTATHFYSFAGYNPTGSVDDIVSWSARGPTPVGEIKPDVVNVGLGCWDAAPLCIGGYDIFSGTSLATPLTAGTLALMLEASNKMLTPAQAKTLLMSTAKDISHNPLVQGAGRVDAYAATLAVKRLFDLNTPGPVTVKVSSIETSKVLQDKLNDAWIGQYAYNIPEYISEWFTGEPLILPYNVPSFTQMESSSMFLGYLSTGTSKTFNFKVTNLNSKTGTLSNLRALTYKLVESETIMGATPAGGGPVWYIFDSSEFSNIDLTRFTLSFNFKYFDYNFNYARDNRLSLFVFEWIDLNGNQQIEYSELIVVNAAYNHGTTEEATVGNLVNRLHSQNSKIVVRVYHTRYSGPSFSIPFELKVLKYTRTKDTSITFTSTTYSINAGSSATISGTLKVPSEPVSGVVEGLIGFEFKTADGTITKYIPYSYMVVGKIGELTTKPSAENKLYDLGVVRGALDWTWRAESGDWRVYAFKVQDLKDYLFKIDLTWSQQNSTLDVYVIGPDGEFASYTIGGGVGYNPYFYNTAGIYIWHCTSEDGTPTKRLTVYSTLVYESFFIAKPKVKPPAVFTILVHQVLHGGQGMSEDLNVTVSSVSGNVRLPEKLYLPLNMWSRVSSKYVYPFTSTHRWYQIEVDNGYLRTIRGGGIGNSFLSVNLDGTLSPSTIDFGAYGEKLEVYPVGSPGAIIISGTMRTANLYYRIGAAYYGPLESDYYFVDFTIFYRRI
ncbi:MAG: S8 family serine peptidase [Nitrososphaeria archaeon]